MLLRCQVAMPAAFALLYFVAHRIEIFIAGFVVKEERFTRQHGKTHHL